MRTGIDRDTGRLLTGWDHCAQSIGVVVQTAVGTRVMRRAFGSDVGLLQDMNPDRRTMMVVFGALATALRRWEPGFRLERIVPEEITIAGRGVFTLAGTFYPRGHLGDYSTSETREARYGADQTRVWRLA
jgi:uncharacterized protein